MQAFGTAYSVVISDLYPVGGPNPNPWLVPQYLSHDVPKFKQPYLLCDQIFARDGGYTEPTLGQWRLMVYGALAEGVKGFFHFVYTVSPLYRVPAGERLFGSMVDDYGTPSPIYQEIEHRLGPDLFSFGELLRTCHPDAVPAEVRLECGTVEDALEHTLPAIALRRLTDPADGYEVLAIYSNDPDKTQTATLEIPKSWLGDRIIMDLMRTCRDILSQTPIQVEGERLPIRLEAGEGRFLAVTAKDSRAPN